MVFSSVLFLFYFLAPLLVLYIIFPKKLKNPLLLAASLLFYAWGEPVYVLLMIFSAMFNYFMGFRLTGINKKKMLFIDCVVNLGMLFIFKYTDFFISTINIILPIKIPLPGIALPIGISFYTFQAMSYCIDVYRGKTPVQRSFTNFAMYLAFFPQLIAGPIVRYDDIAAQLDNHPIKLNKFADGLYRFCVGLAKKVLIANNLGQLWELTASGSDISMLTAWIGIIAYTVQIYYDFSGYSDMAIGLGKMFGFEFIENFDYPYISRSITEFWHRWHISLGTWFKEYVYIPLGGSRVYAENYPDSENPERSAMLRRNGNIMAVWLLTGLWHGASFNFVAWGLYYGILLIIEKQFLLKKLEKTTPVIGNIYTMFIVVIGWVFFASANFGSAFSYIGSMFNFTNIGFTDNMFLYRLFSYGPVLIAAIIGSTPVPKKIFIKLTRGKYFWVRPVLAFVILLICTAYLVDSTYNPFLYFRF